MFHQLDPIFQLHAMKKSAILETVELPGARGHLACPLVFQSGAQGSYDGPLLRGILGDAVGIWFHPRFF
jgi:hypothetical protein